MLHEWFVYVAWGRGQTAAPRPVCTCPCVACAKGEGVRGNRQPTTHGTGEGCAGVGEESQGLSRVLVSTGGGEAVHETSCVCST